MAWTTPGTAVAGDVLTAARWNSDVRDNSNSLSRGIVAKISQTSDYTCTNGSTSDVTSCSVTWTAESDRIYLLAFNTYVTKNTNAGNVIIQITDSSNNLKQDRATSIGNVSFPFQAFHMEVYETGLSGSITRKIRAQSSTAGAVLNGGSGYPRQFYVIDMGLA